MFKIEEKLIQDAIDFRRVLHQYPELSVEEV